MKKKKEIKFQFFFQICSGIISCITRRIGTCAHTTRWMRFNFRWFARGLFFKCLIFDFYFLIFWIKGCAWSSSIVVWIGSCCIDEIGWFIITSKFWWLKYKCLKTKYTIMLKLNFLKGFISKQCWWSKCSSKTTWF